jgi:uncharacterized repeat protein (TIGR01451 family)
MIAFGGGLAFFGTDQNDTSTLSNANGVVSPSAWSTLSTSGGPPGVREGHRAVYDRASNRMTVFGGQNLISTCCPYDISDYNDVWVLSNANGAGGSPAWAQQVPSGSAPAPRSNHSAVYDSTNNRLVAFGGLTWSNDTQSSTVLGDLWQLSNANGLDGPPAWTPLAPSGTPPGPNYLHVAAFDAATQRMIVFGGLDQAFTAHRRVWVLVFETTSSADLMLMKTDPPGRAPTGRNLTYTLTVTNNGPEDASGVSVDDQLPPSVTFISAAPSQGTCGQSAGTVSCYLGTVGSGGTATIDIVVKPTAAGMITNTASVSGSTADPNGDNNADSESTSVCRITSRKSSIPCP